MMRVNSRFKSDKNLNRQDLIISTETLGVPPSDSLRSLAFQMQTQTPLLTRELKDDHGDEYRRSSNAVEMGNHIGERHNQQIETTSTSRTWHHNVTTTIVQNRAKAMAAYGQRVRDYDVGPNLGTEPLLQRRSVGDLHQSADVDQNRNGHTVESLLNGCQAPESATSTLAEKLLDGCPRVLRELLFRLTSRAQSKRSASVVVVANPKSAALARNCEINEYGRQIGYPSFQLPDLSPQAWKSVDARFRNTLLLFLADPKYQAEADLFHTLNGSIDSKTITYVEYVAAKIGPSSTNTIGALINASYTVQILECSGLMEHFGFGPNSQIRNFLRAQQLTDALDVDKINHTTGEQQQMMLEPTCWVFATRGLEQAIPSAWLNLEYPALYQSCKLRNFRDESCQRAQAGILPPVSAIVPRSDCDHSGVNVCYLCCLGVCPTDTIFSVSSFLHIKFSLLILRLVFCKFSRRMFSNMLL